MRTRYFLDEKGKPAIKALVYDKQDLPLDEQSLDADALKICARLVAQGHDAYIVGGAVRDLLVNRTPKDFDIATDASPTRVKKIFKNSRIIGKRFRLVHIFFPQGKIHEVATFRAPESRDRNHVYGTLPEDALRRDFTLNALYYDPRKKAIIDFTGGVKDIQKKIIKSVLPLKSSFVEDPVRMLRAVKYAAMTQMKIAYTLGLAIKRQARLLSGASLSRLSEELYKILKSGSSEKVFRLMDHYGLLSFLLPRFADLFSRSGGEQLKGMFLLNLAALDEQVAEGEESRGVMIRYLVEHALVVEGVFDKKEKQGPLFLEVFQQTKEVLKPLVQPNRNIEEAVRMLFQERGLKIPRRRAVHRFRGSSSGKGEGSFPGVHKDDFLPPLRPSRKPPRKKNSSRPSVPSGTS